jgi:hypothetical protein
MLASGLCRLLETAVQAAVMNVLNLTAYVEGRLAQEKRVLDVEATHF